MPRVAMMSLEYPRVHSVHAHTAGQPVRRQRQPQDGCWVASGGGGSRENVVRDRFEGLDQIQERLRVVHGR